MTKFSKKSKYSIFSLNYKTSTPLALFFCIFLMGCQQIWFFDVTDATNPEFPTFRVSMDYEGEKAINLSMFSIEEIDSKGNPQKDMWLIDRSGGKLFIKYGEVPAGAIEEIKATPLALDTLYRVNGGRFYFRIHKSDNGIFVETADINNYKYLLKQR